MPPRKQNFQKIKSKLNLSPVAPEEVEDDPFAPLSHEALIGAFEDETTEIVPADPALREIAVLALVRVARDKTAPPAAVAAAARTLLESLGDIGRLQALKRQAEKPLNELTKNEIDAEIARLSTSA